jgi:succinate dehydrogenase / fumarate reductase membrane anchor subunit
MSLRSPLGRVLGLGAAKEGVGHWWVQRVSSVALTILTLWFVFALAALGDFSYPAVVTWIGSPINAVLLTILIVTTVYHTQLGLQVVVEDYVASPGPKILTMLAINFILVLLGGLGVFSVLRVAFGAVA